MHFLTSSWKDLAGQNDVHAGLHVPMVYEKIAASPVLWEYRVLHVDTREAELPTEESLNELGSQGWLLVSIMEQHLGERGSRVSYYFTRQKEA